MRNEIRRKKLRDALRKIVKEASPMLEDSPYYSGDRETQLYLIAKKALEEYYG